MPFHIQEVIWLQEGAPQCEGGEKGGGAVEPELLRVTSILCTLLYPTQPCWAAADKESKT